jgi:hypothetical protein
MVMSMNTTVFWDVASCSLVKFTDVSEVLAASIIMAIALMTYNLRFLQSKHYTSPIWSKMQFAQQLSCRPTILNFTEINPVVSKTKNVGRGDRHHVMQLMHLTV